MEKKTSQENTLAFKKRDSTSDKVWYKFYF